MMSCDIKDVNCYLAKHCTENLYLYELASSPKWLGVDFSLKNVTYQCIFCLCYIKKNSYFRKFSSDFFVALVSLNGLHKVKS